MKKQPIYKNWTLEECESYCQKQGITMAQLFLDPEKETLVPVAEEDRHFLCRFLSLGEKERALVIQIADLMASHLPPSPKCPK